MVENNSGLVGSGVVNQRGHTSTVIKERILSELWALLFFRSHSGSSCLIIGVQLVVLRF